MMGFWRGSGIRWTICKQSAPRSREITTLTPHHSPVLDYLARGPELIPVLGSQPAGDVNFKPDGRLPLPSAGPAVTPTTLKRAATNFAVW